MVSGRRRCVLVQVDLPTHNTFGLSLSGDLDRVRSRSERLVKAESLRRLQHLIGGDPEEQLDERNVKNILGIIRPSSAIQHSSLCLLKSMKKEDIEYLRKSNINFPSAEDSLSR
jgi:hypothetical protein